MEDAEVNKILVDGGAAVNLILQLMLERIGKFVTDLRPHNWPNSGSDLGLPNSWVYYKANYVHGHSIQGQLQSTLGS